MADQKYKRYLDGVPDIVVNDGDSSLIDLMDNWDKCIKSMGISSLEASDITAISDRHTQRKAALAKYKEKNGLDATYHNLIICYLENNFKGTAANIAELFKGGEATSGASTSSGTTSGGATSGANTSVAARTSGSGLDLSKCLTTIKYVEGGEKKSFFLKNRCSTKWRAIGLLLGIESNKLDTYGRDPERCFENVITDWRGGKGANEYPVGWDGLYSLLEDIELSQVATELKNAVEKHC